MPHLTLDLLGPMQVTLDGATVAFRSDKERALLAFLAVEADRPHRREALTGLLYPEQEQTQAQSNLRKTLFRLRAALGEKENDAGLLLITPKTVQFNPASPHTLDVEQFRARLEQIRQHKHRRAETCAACAANLVAANELYRGEFLAGFNRSGSEAFEEWAVITREQLHQHALDALEQLLAFYIHRSDWERVIPCARRLLELEAWRESAHRALMTAFVAQRQRAAALAQYDACKKILAEQFDAEPERETRALSETIRAGTFTPLQSPSDALYRTNLPSALTPFIGRAREIETLTARLLDPTQRLHTIVGPGGMGKTRLALAAAERVRDDFQHGAFFVALAGIPNDAADALNVTFNGSIAPARQLQTFLRDKEALLILDNFEQLMASASWIVELVAVAPRITILVTSREPLNARAETILRLDGLSAPNANDELDVRANDSVQLFVERAARAAGQFTVTPSSLHQVSLICHRVEGMPLALELAAAWTRTRTLDEILAALDQNLDLLATNQRDVPSRHSSLRAVWQGSWDLLSPREQVILTQISVFRGGFTQNAAEIIITAQQNDLDALINKSLLKRTEDGRYELHELLRQFLSECLFENAIHVSKEHGQYFFDYIAQRGIKLQNSEPQIVLIEIRHELDNLRAAWQNALDHEWFDLFQPEIVEGITAFYYLTGLFREGLTMIEQVLIGAEKTSTVSREHVVHLQLARAKFLERLARYDDATKVLEELLADETTAETLRARAQLRVGWVCYWTGKLEEGRAVLRETLAWASAQQQTALQADVLYVAGLIEQSASHTQQARECYERALVLYRASNNRYGESSALVNLADIAVDQTRLDDALRHGKAALALSMQIGKRFDQAAANIILGSIFYELGNFARAAPHYTEALRLFREMGNGSGESIAQRDSAMLALQRGNVSDALAYAQEAAQVANQVGSTYREGMAQRVMGDAYFRLKEFSHAERAYQDAVQLLSIAERGHHALDARAGLVRVAVARNEIELARRRLAELLGSFDAKNFYDSEEPSAIYLTCYQVLTIENPLRAREILQRGMEELNLRAAQIQDDALRYEFLENNPASCALRQAYQRAFPV